MTTLVRSGGPQDQDLESLRARAAGLEASLAERAAAYTRVRAEIDAFRIRYRQEVGLLHERIDELERAIDEEELGEINKRLDEAGVDPEAADETAPLDAAPRFTSDAVRKLFRDVAKAIHPDLAEDADARDRRHWLMVEANRAYELGDEERLRSILEAWERSPDAVEGSDDDAMRLRLERRIAQIEEQLAAYDAELAALHESSIGRLKAMVDQAAAEGRDLIREMVRRLEREVLIAQNRLDAMRWRP